MKIKIQESLDALKAKYPDTYCSVKVEATYHDSTGETDLQWRLYVSDIGWSDEAKTFEAALKALQKEAEKKNAKQEMGSFVEED